ncbi:hypothetical protein HDU90_005624 [Geranomyces variabilis]|nr:hypothetical protein HDU90_005624 [Geranomyces variabilis]
MVSSERDTQHSDAHSSDNGYAMQGTRMGSEFVSDSGLSNGGGGGGGGGGGNAGADTADTTTSTTGGGAPAAVTPTKFHKPNPNPLHLPNDILHSTLLPPAHSQHQHSSLPHTAAGGGLHSAYSSQTASTQSSPVLAPSTPTQPSHPVFSIGTTPIHTSYSHALQHQLHEQAQHEQQQQQHHHHQQQHNPHNQQPQQQHYSASNGYSSSSNAMNGVTEIHSNVSTPTSTPRSSMSINDLCNSTDVVAGLNGHEPPFEYPTDPDVQMAAEALGGLRNGGMQRRPSRQSSQEHFMQRVQNIPLVNKSINQISTAYEATKNASRVVKYSAESVETGVKTITKPVFNKLEPALAPLDRFACNQLDKLERSFPSIMGTSPPPPEALSTLEPPRLEYRSRPRSLSSSSMSSISSLDLLQPPNVPLLDARSPQMNGSLGGGPSSPSAVSIPGPPLTNALGPPSSPGGFRTAEGEGPVTTTAPHIDRKPRSRWNQVVAGVGGSLSGLMLSDETMRGLKYCLQWLQYATNHIDRQVMMLRDYLARAGGNVATYLSNMATGASQPTPPLSPHANDMTVATAGTNIFAIVASIRREVVETLRRVVDVIGRYAAVYLPGDARRSVRGFILALPGRWATLTNGTASSSNAVDGGPQSAEAEAQKVLTLAAESSNMLKGVQSIFTESLDGAERFGRVVGPAPSVTDPFGVASPSAGPAGAGAAGTGSSSASTSRSTTPTPNSIINGASVNGGGGAGAPAAGTPELISGPAAVIAVAAAEPRPKRRRKRSGDLRSGAKGKGSRISSTKVSTSSDGLLLPNDAMMDTSDNEQQQSQPHDENSMDTDDVVSSATASPNGYHNAHHHHHHNHHHHSSRHNRHHQHSKPHTASAGGQLNHYPGLGSDEDEDECVDVEQHDDTARRSASPDRMDVS